MPVATHKSVSGWAVRGCVLKLRFLFLVLATVPLATIAAPSVMPVRAITSISMTVSDMDRSVAFYRTVMNFELVSDQERAGDDYEHLYGVFGARVRIVTLRLGGETLKLEEFIAPHGRPIPVDSKSNDAWFQHVAIIVRDMDQAFAWLRNHQVQFASTGPQVLPLWNPNAGGIAAFYFRDPDGHSLEILHFPPGKGDPKWQAAGDTLFLGIDHSAIVVADTDASLSYYHDTLGLKVVGSSENYGSEQERLNNVFGARLRITALRAERGPGVELLEYLAPRTGRPMPFDTQSNDLWNWHIDMQADVAQADAAVRRQHYHYVSPGAIHFTSERRQSSLMIRDPDGHETLLDSN
jgi:catechol 2,3-dioxygenase-like lactoylglutathione lyase family enzyme